MDTDFAVIGLLVRPEMPRIRFLFVGSRLSFGASFGPRLATTPLRFADPALPSAWVEDLHLQAVEQTRHTKEAGRLSAALLSFTFDFGLS